MFKKTLRTNMKAFNLSKIWDVPDNSRLMKKQTSVRLPVHIGAKIAALCEMYPVKSKSEIINDLLFAALDELEDGFEFEPGEIVAPDRQSNKFIAEDIGQRPRFFRIVNKYIREFEKELGNDQPSVFNEDFFDTVDEK